MVRRLQEENLSMNSSWICDHVHISSAGSAKLWSRSRKTHRWAGKPEPLPSILRRQRDVKGIVTLIRGGFAEENTPPSSSAHAVTKFPCLCWSMEVWLYLYPFWHDTVITKTYLAASYGGSPEVHQSASKFGLISNQSSCFLYCV